jgi:hypothetical protein
MTPQPDRTIHVSRLPFRDEPIDCAAVYCSDARWGDHVDDLVRRQLEIAQFDRLAVPGGPATLVEHAPCFFETQSLARQLQFLVEAHRLRKVLLIAHEGCMFYLERLRVSPQEIDAQQRRDLAEAVARVREKFPGLSVEAIIARVIGDRVRFEGGEC